MENIVDGGCGWCGADARYVPYPDTEWGRLVTDDQTLFEFLVCESAPVGLSGIAMFPKRAGCCKAFGIGR